MGYEKKKKGRLFFPDEPNVAMPEEAALEAFEKMSAEELAGFEPEGEIPRVTGQKTKLPIPLYGYYGDAFFNSKVSAELMEKEQHRFYKREDTYDDEIEILEQGLCDKYGIIPPTKWPNRRKDRGTNGEQLLILGQTANDRRHPKLWGIRQEDRTRHCFCIGGSGSGKATTLDTKILLADGWSTVGDVKIGDQVYGRDGELATVTHIFEQGELPVWEIEFADHQVVRCSAEHLWTVIRESHGNRKESVEPLWELQALGIAVDNGNDVIEHPFSIPLCEPMDFPEKDLPIHPYVLGALLGDGSIVEKRAPIMSSADQEIADRISSYLGDDYTLAWDYPDLNYSWRIREKDENGKFGSPKRLAAKLTELGVRHKSENKFIPKIYKFASIEQRRLLLQGLMDTDGTAHAGRFAYTTISKQLRDDVMELARGLGYHVSYGVDHRPEKYPNSDGKCWNVAIHSNDYENIFALERKKDDYLDYASQRSRMKTVYEHEMVADLTEDDLTIDETLPLHPYLLGAFLRFSVSRSNIITNQELTEEQQEMLFSKDDRLELRCQPQGKSICPYIDGGRMKNGKHKNLVLYAFRELGLAVKNTEKRLPKQYLKANYATRLALLQGIADFNGSFSHRYWEFFSRNKELIDDVEQLARSVGFTYCNRGTDGFGSHYICVGISDLCLFSLPSRLEYARKILKRNTADRENYNDDNKIIDIRKTDEVEPMRCFIVDNPSHTYIIEGYIVTHNSTLLHAIGVEDMWYWRGGLLMEPHGDLAMGLLRTAPPYRLHDIIYLNVLDPLASPGFNPLELPLNATDEMRAEATGTVTTLISKHFNMDATSMPRLAKMLTNALNALSWVPGATLLEIMDFYVNEDIRNTVLSFVPDGPSKDAMSDLAQNAKTEDLGTLENRISRFTTNRFMKHLFGQSHTTVNFFELMNEGKYIICPASKGGTSDDTFLKFYGSYIVSEVYKAAVMRESIEEGDRVNFALTLDEFQNFISDDIEGILAEARKYGLMMMLANQYLDQLTKPIQSAVLQNCATKLCYNLGPTDAPTMARALGFGLKAEDMQAIPKYHVMAAPLINGGPVHPFISAVFPPISLKSEVSGITASLIMEISRDKYMKNRNEIDKEIMDRKERFASGNKDAVRELMTKKNR